MQVARHSSVLSDALQDTIGMKKEQDKEAEDWLDQLYKDLATEPLYQKSPEDIPDRVAMEISGYTPELQEAVRRVIGKWLQSPDPNKVDNALDLAYRLKTTEHLPMLERLYEDIRLGRSSLPSFWHTSSHEVADSVRLIIEHLSANE
ncbi:MAG TPA: hypothetical protein PKV43_11890 [Armatimonadota bacterium]|nr:hypothetical protein [Armatimonadota bacterium]